MWSVVNQTIEQTMEQKKAAGIVSVMGIVFVTVEPGVPGRIVVRKDYFVLMIDRFFTWIVCPGLARMRPH